MRWNALFLVLLSFSCFGQENPGTDSTATTNFEKSHQVGLPWNGALITVMQNPAFAGIDRKLQVGYSYEGQNLYQAEPKPDSKKLAFWNHTGIVDFAFGGKRKNAGVNLTYNGGLDYVFRFYQLNIAHSYRFRFRKHFLTAGFGIRYVKIENQNNFGPLPDELDPVWAFIYISTYPGRTTEGVNYSAGLIYNWKRVFFSYAFRYEHRSFSNIGKSDLQPFHHLNASYGLDFNSWGSFAASFTAEYDNFDWFFDPAVVLSWKSLFFFKISAPDLKQIQGLIGMQLFSRIRFVFSGSTYYTKYQMERNGLASISGGIRYQFNPLPK